MAAEAALNLTTDITVNPLEACPDITAKIGFEIRLERGRFVWPSAEGGSVAITAAQLAYMLDGIDWVRGVQLVGERGCKSLTMEE